MSWTVSGSTYHYLLIGAPAKSFFKPLGSVSEATILKSQRVHLILKTRQSLSVGGNISVKKKNKLYFFLLGG